MANTEVLRPPRLILALARRGCLLFLLAAALLVPAGALAQGAMLRAGDVFEMRLSGAPAEFAQEFTGQCTVAEDGSVGIPLIGSVKAAGLTPSQLQNVIQSKLVSGKFFTAPVINISLPQQSRSVTVGGEVKAPQAVIWTADLTLSSAIKRAGGPTEFGNLKRVKLTRDGKSTAYNLKRVDREPAQNPRLLPGDEVEVPE